MRFSIRVSSRAYRDLSRLAEFLTGDSPSGAEKAKAAIWSAIAALDRFPNRGVSTRMTGVRERYVRFGRSGYVIRYLIDGREVVILALFHALEDR